MSYFNKIVRFLFLRSILFLPNYTSNMTNIPKLYFIITDHAEVLGREHDW